VPPEPTVSVIVPAPRLTAVGRRCLEHLLALPHPVEILFVPDEAEDVPDGVRCIPSGKVKVGDKRQLALEHSTGQFVALMDDDAYPHRSWRENALEAFADEDVAAVTGPTITPADDEELAQLGGRVFASPLVAGPNRWRYAPGEARDVDEGTGVNVMFRREVALAITLRSDYYPGCDTVLGNRLHERGARIRYVPGMIAYHTRRKLWRPHLTQIWRYARHRGIFVWRFGGISRSPSYFIPSAFLLWALVGWLGPGWLDRIWAASLLLYAAACVAFGFDRRPGRWWRLALAVPASHLTYGVGFVLGLVGVPVPEERARWRARRA
jgi:cellulose synthase/poly-beta-1,6-N-acetylglucosamine synthase-like glycosyltransferase